MATGKKKEAEVVEMNEGSVVVLPKLSQRQDLAQNIGTLAELREKIGQEVVWSDIEPSFAVVHKSVFEGIPVIIGGFRFNESSKFAQPDPAAPHILNPAIFVSLLVASYDEDSEELISPWVIVNDGSTGICNQIKRYLGGVAGEDFSNVDAATLNVWAQKVAPIRTEKGFRKSEYPYTDEKGAVSTATTWYLS